MTAPTSDRAQRQRLADALRDSVCITNGNALRVASAVADYITERLGGGERESAGWSTEDNDRRIRGWVRVLDALRDVYPTMDIDHRDAPTHDRPVLAIRTLAQTAKDAMARLAECSKALHERMQEIAALAQRATDAEQRATTLEAANTGLDNARKSAEQSARDLRAENARLRAQLDAMTGEQKPWAYDVKGWGIFRCKDEQTLEKELQHAAKMTYRTDFQPIPLYRHPSPAARVVGACVVGIPDRPNGTYVWVSEHLGGVTAKEREAQAYAARHGGTAHTLLLGPALTPNADGAQ